MYVRLVAFGSLRHVDGVASGHGAITCLLLLFKDGGSQNT